MKRFGLPYRTLSKDNDDSDANFTTSSAILTDGDAPTSLFDPSRGLSMSKDNDATRSLPPDLNKDLYEFQNSFIAVDCHIVEMIFGGKDVRNSTIF